MHRSKRIFLIKWLIIFAASFPLVSCGQNSNQSQQNQNSNQNSNATNQDTTSNQNNNNNGGMMGGGMMKGHMMGHGMMGGNRANSTSTASNESTNVWVAPASANNLKNPLAGIVKASNEGKKIFDQFCITCHGKTGEGNGPTGEMLEPKPANLTSKTVQKQSDGAIFWKITNGKGAMASYKNILSKDKRWELIDYIRVLGKAGKSTQ